MLMWLKSVFWGCSHKWETTDIKRISGSTFPSRVVTSIRYVYHQQCEHCGKLKFTSQEH